MMNCPNCDTELPEDAKFCLYCGPIAELEEKAEPSESEPEEESSPITFSTDILKAPDPDIAMLEYMRSLVEAREKEREDIRQGLLAKAEELRKRGWAVDGLIEGIKSEIRVDFKEGKEMFTWYEQKISQLKTIEDRFESLAVHKFNLNTTELERDIHDPKSDLNELNERVDKLEKYLKKKLLKRATALQKEGWNVEELEDKIKENVEEGSELLTLYEEKIDELRGLRERYDSTFSKNHNVYDPKLRYDLMDPKNDIDELKKRVYKFEIDSGRSKDINRDRKHHIISSKPHLNLVFIGHVDHGKSTLVGRTLFETGAVEAHKIEEFRKKAEEIGKGSFEFAWVMDRWKEERERGLTIDIMHQRFDTDKYYFTIIDAPGHRDFIKNMITGTSQADAAVMVVAAPEGIMAQTREHAFLARTLGVSQLIVVVNKMDATKPEYSRERFNAVKEEMTKLLTNIGYRYEQFTILPMSALQGDNLKAKSPNMSWWSGINFLQAIDNLKVPEKPINQPLRLPVQDVYNITGIGTVPVGRVETGIMKPGQRIIFMPANVPGEVKSIEQHHEPIPQAIPGDNCGFNVRGVGKTDIRKGDVAGPIDNPPTVAETFDARIIVLDHPSVVTVGYTPVFHAHTAQVACTFIELKQKINPRTGEVVEKNPTYLKNGDAAVVTLKPTKLFSLETASDFPEMARFAIRDMGQTVAAGQCISIVPKKM